MNMKDPIERQDAIDAVNIGNLSRSIVKALQNIILELPSTEKYGQWIPVSERLPEYGEQVVVNFHNEQIGRNRIGVSYCYVQKEGFFSDVPFEYKVVAWMPLPEPYQEGEQND